MADRVVAMPGERVRPGERTLPVRRSKDLIVDKVKLNRVTLISADTGSGAHFRSVSSLFSMIIVWLLSFLRIHPFSSCDSNRSRPLLLLCCYGVMILL